MKQDRVSRRYFNPRAYVRHDVRDQYLQSAPGFQSTCLREARLGARFSLAAATDFNPRAYVRHDPSRSRPPLPAHFNPRAYVRHDLQG